MPAIYYQDAIAQRYGLDPRTIDLDEWADFIGRVRAMETIRERAAQHAIPGSPTE